MRSLGLCVIALFLLLAEARAAETRLPKPSGNLNVKIAETSGDSFSRLPARVTETRLNGEGWKIETVRLKGTDLIVEAVSSGIVQLARSQILDVLRAVQKGAKISLILEERPGEFILIARKGITKCSDLNGKTYAIHSTSSPYAVTSAKWMADQCGAKTKNLVIAGGENRVVALMNGQIDATFVQLSDWINLNHQRPGEFPIVMKFSEELEGLMGGVIYTHIPWLEKQRELAATYLAEVLLDIRKVATDPKPLEEVAKRYQTEEEFKTFPQTYEAYMRDLGGLPQNGGLTRERVRSSIDLFTGLNLIKPGLTVEQVANLSILDGALRKIGKISGKR